MSKISMIAAVAENRAPVIVTAVPVAAVPVDKAQISGMLEDALGSDKTFKIIGCVAMFPELSCAFTVKEQLPETCGIPDTVAGAMYPFG